MDEKFQRLFSIFHRRPTHRARAIDHADVLFRLINRSLCQQLTIGLDMNKLDHLEAFITEPPRIYAMWLKQLVTDSIVMLEINIKLYILRVVFELFIIFLMGLGKFTMKPFKNQSILTTHNLQQ